MNIYTNYEMTANVIPASYAATAAKFILEDRRGNEATIWPNAKCLKPFKDKKVTIQKINELTQQIIADTKY